VSLEPIGVPSFAVSRPLQLGTNLAFPLGARSTTQAAPPVLAGFSVRMALLVGSYQLQPWLQVIAPAVHGRSVRTALWDCSWHLNRAGRSLRPLTSRGHAAFQPLCDHRLPGKQPPDRARQLFRRPRDSRRRSPRDLRPV